MKFQEYLVQVQKDSQYQKFVKENPEAYLCAAFFMIDYKDKHNESSIDYFNPKDSKVMTFTIEKEIKARPLDALQEGLIPKKMQEISQIEIEQLQGIIVDEMHNRTITGDIQKVICILQNLNGKLVWHCTAFLTGLNLIKTDIEDESKSVIFMEKVSFMDLLKAPADIKKELQEKLKKAKKSENHPADKEKTEGNNEGFIG